MRKLARIRWRGNHKVRNSFRRSGGNSWWATHNMLQRQKLALSMTQLQAVEALAQKVIDATGAADTIKQETGTPQFIQLAA